MRILVVEDETEIADGIKAILIQGGYEVDIVHDGNSGTDYLLSGIYDLALLDLMLPGMDGFDVLTSVRKEGISTPVIILTARSMSCDKIRGLDLGADDYLTKPFDAGELLARVRARIRSAHTDQQYSDTIKAYDLTLDPFTYKLKCDGKEIKLSNKEYLLMEYLMINKGMILTREMIFNRVWGPDGEAEYNSSDVYVSFLRKKMRFIGAGSEIVTKKGVGYSLEQYD